MDVMDSPLIDIIDSLQFDNRFVKELPFDQETGNFTRQVLGACYSRVQPLTVSSPSLIAFSQEMARTPGLPSGFCRSKEFTRIFSGNDLMPGMDPFAMCYGGHQFGNWAGQQTKKNHGQCESEIRAAQLPCPDNH